MKITFSIFKKIVFFMEGVDTTLLSKCDPDIVNTTDEFSKLSKLSEKKTKDYSCYVGMTGGNRFLNRYGNVIPFDENRVILGSLGMQMTFGSDYINASWFNKGSETPSIVTQGPIEKSRGAFWAMIWEQNVPAIFMLTKMVEDGRRKCDMYWPIEKTDTFGDLRIEMVDEKSLYEGNVTVRTFRLTYKGEEKTTVQIHYTEWSDFGVPLSTDIIQKVGGMARAYQKKGHPIVIHCSAGVGRAGTFVSMITLLDKFDKIFSGEEAPFDIFETVLHLRTYRRGLIQTEEQYQFLYRVVHDYVKSRIEKQ